MSLSFESQSATASQDHQFPKATQSSPGPASAAPRLYRVIWRWHFYAGIIVAPVLIVMAATGALYIFKDEIERLLYAELMYVSPGPTRVSFDDQLAAAITAAGSSPGLTIRQFAVPIEPDEATIFYASSGEDFRSLFVDPYHGRYQGELGETNFFSVVLRIHRTLFVGTVGRIVVELVTCWTIVLLASGIYLWWPRKREQIWGTWLPRLRGNPYVMLRDLHAVSGVYVATVALIIASTGLLYTLVWGSGYGYAASKRGAYDIFLNPPRSRSSAGLARVSLDEIVAAARQVLPGNTLSVTIPADPAGAFVVFGSRPTGPSSDGVAVIDHATAEVLLHRTNRQFPTLGWWVTWNYPLHVGSILGVPTKILWLLASLGLILLPVTGVYMWWQRRPRGHSGFPRRPNTRIPRKLVLGILLLALVLPVLGLSIALILWGELIVARIRDKQRMPA